MSNVERFSKDPIIGHVNIIIEINDEKIVLEDIEKNHLLWVLRTRCKQTYNNLCAKIAQLTSKMR